MYSTSCIKAYSQGAFYHNSTHFELYLKLKYHEILQKKYKRVHLNMDAYSVSIGERVNMLVLSAGGPEIDTRFWTLIGNHCFNGLRHIRHIILRRGGQSWHWQLCYLLHNVHAFSPERWDGYNCVSISQCSSLSNSIVWLHNCMIASKGPCPPYI